MAKRTTVKLAPICLEEPHDDLSKVKSQLVQFENRLGRRVVGFLDYTSDSFISDPVVIIPPGYGQTKRDMIPLSFPLAKAGFSVLRYDHTDHVGESDGEIIHSSLESMQHDLEGALDYVKHELCAPKIGVAAYSLTFRSALRVAIENNQIDFLCSILGIVDVRELLKNIYAQDIVDLSLSGVKWGITDLLGFKVDADRFLWSAIDQSMHTLEGTIKDAQKMSNPLLFIVGGEDFLTKQEAIERVFQSAAAFQKELFVVRDSKHVFHENVESLRMVTQAVVRAALKYLVGRELVESEIGLCDGEVADRSEWEKSRIRSLNFISKQEELSFWREYLKDFKRIVNLPDYWNLQEMIHDLLGEIGSGERVLDAGCGAGNLGSFLIVKYLYRAMENSIFKKKLPLFHYAGVDFVHDALKEADKTLEALQKDFLARMGLLRTGSLVACNFFQLDLASPLSFKAGSFDKICCNLVLSYVPDGAFTLSQLWRALKPGGRIVVTSLKPHADLSYVYRTFLERADSAKEIEDARALLANAGMIKAREVEGLYNFYSETDLKGMLFGLGASRVHVGSAFSNQVYVGLAEKAD